MRSFFFASVSSTCTCECAHMPEKERLMHWVTSCLRQDFSVSLALIGPAGVIGCSVSSTPLFLLHVCGLQMCTAACTSVLCE